MFVVEVSELCKSYGDRLAVEDASLSVERGEIFGLIGPNGAGKTTVIECIEGLRVPDRGRIRVLGLDPARDGREMRRLIGCQLQDSALPHRIKVREALKLFASLAPGASRWEELLEQWGLADKRDAAFGSLSGGQRQRLFVALALVNDPEVVFLDEMTTGLDPAARRTAWDLIRRLRDRGATVILVTHFMDEAEELCDWLAVMRQGRIIAADSPRGLIDRFAPGINITFSSENGDLGWLEQLGPVHSMSRRGRRVSLEADSDALVAVAGALFEHGLHPADLDVNRPSLEDVFLALTGERAADEPSVSSGEGGSGRQAGGGPGGAAAGHNRAERPRMIKGVRRG